MAQKNAASRSSRGMSAGQTIDAMPTKALFIRMLTRDIALVPAIIDLVDNAVDGARKLRGSKKYDGLHVKLTINSSYFAIEDNCGGIALDTARKYAFRFGRDEHAPTVSHSIGEFGVGMKRAVFKLGGHFKVTSTTPQERFVVDVDVGEWASEDEWQFRFSEVDRRRFGASATGTRVEVSVLHKDVSEKFALPIFEAELLGEIQRRLQPAIVKGLAIIVNSRRAEARSFTMLSSRQLLPAFKENTYPVKSERVTVRIFCGLGKRDPSMAGWHIYCNDRLVLEADKTVVTGWGDRGRGIDAPGFHNQYNHFRGVVYFDSDNPGLLPWNTTKTGVDSDSAIFRTVRLEMAKMMRPVIQFLNHLKLEKQTSDSDTGDLEALVENSPETDITSIRSREAFYVDVAVKPPKLAAQRISFEARTADAERVKKALGAKSWKGVGEGVFNYYIENEID